MGPFTYGYGASTDAAHLARMESIASTLPDGDRLWYLKATLTTRPHRDPFIAFGNVDLPLPPNGGLMPGSFGNADQSG